MRQLLFAAAFAVLFAVSTAKKSKESAKPDWAKKDVRDFNDADLERLYEQWEEDEEPLEPDELPEYMRPAPKIDMSKMDASNPENILRASKKGRMLMTFITLLGKPTREETEEITSIWQTSLMNNHINVDRYILDDNRALFTFRDGSQAWEAKDYLIQQDQLETITIENKPYYGKNAGDKELQDLIDLINKKYKHIKKNK
ncbi:LDLR chaperone boca isoform X1 [Dermacentor variabilis]|uniref:LDLR chaperone boca isoform X1 n=1 Tax=Dermacentor variabilis TaxID=34621 RepID=UPI003F5C8366